MKRSPLRKSTKKPLGTIKRKAWKAFSLWIRNRGSVSGLNYCVTCGEQKPIKELQAGHLVDGRGNGVLFDERGVYPQCLACNVFKHGNKIAYMQFLERGMGIEGAIKLRDELQTLSKTVKKMTYSDYETIYLKYKETE